MAVPLEQFVKSLEESGVIARGKLENFLPPRATPKDAQELARELVKSKQLTKYQAQEIYQGRARALILGNYTILDRIGAGGMGQVFKAEHRRMKRVVALKMLPASLTKDAVAVARFQREVEAAAKLRHPHIVAADDADEASGIHFLVMEFVDGSDLAALVKTSGPLSVAKAVNCVLQAARGLEFAHKKGVVHRDIKPGNLLLDNEGVVKILDMGLARIEARGDTATQAELTGTGAVMGTVDYMAPEQALSTKHADVRADIYSLGCTLYYLLTGRALYDGETLMSKLIAHREEPIPSLRDNCPAATAQLDDVFKRMVAKRADDRHASMGEVAADLERCSATGDAPLSSPGNSLSAELDDGLLTFLRDVPETSASRARQGSTRQVSSRQNPPQQGSTKQSLAEDKSLRHPIAPRSTQQKKLILALSGGAGVLLVILAAFLLLKGGEGSEKTAKKQSPPSKSTGKKDDVPAFPLPEKKFGGTTPKFTGSPATNGPITPTVLRVPDSPFALEFNPGDKAETPPIPLGNSYVLTMEAWVKFMGEDRDEYVRALNGQLGNTLGGGTFYTYHGSADGKTPLPRNQWIHIAGVDDGKERRLYVDGKLVASYNQGGGPPPGVAETPISIGNEKYRGQIAGVRVSRMARYQGDFEPPLKLTADKDTFVAYDFSVGQGNTLKDLSTNKHDAKITGARWIRLKPVAEATSNAVLTSDYPALRFDYVENSKPGFIEIASLQLPVEGPLTIEGYLKLDRDYAGPNPTYFGAPYEFSIGGHKFDLNWYAYPEDTAAGTKPGPFALPNTQSPGVNVWHHVAGVRDGKEHRFYVNGAKVGSLPATQPLTFDDHWRNFYLGIMCDGVHMREVRVSNVARYAGEKFMPEPRYTPDKNTLALFHLDEGAGDDIKDSSGHGHHGKRIPTTQWVRKAGSD